MKSEEKVHCYCCKKEIGKDEISMGMGSPETGPRYWCYDCEPIENDSGEFGFGGNWWKS